MRVELVSYLAGGLSLELIAESELEVTLLKHAWREMDRGEKPRTGNGQSMTGIGSIGFYLPITARPPADPSA